MKFKKGDTIIVMTGKDKGRKGSIERLYLHTQKVLVTGIGMYKKHVKKSEQAPQGGVVEVPRPILSSKIAYFCANCKKGTRIGYSIANKSKVRICRTCNKSI